MVRLDFYLCEKMLERLGDVLTTEKVPNTGAEK